MSEKFSRRGFITAATATAASVVSATGASALGRVASVLARGESLTAHARSAEYRIQEEQ